MKKLTPKQKECLDIITECYSLFGLIPSQVDLANALETNANLIFKVVTRLRHKGYIVIDKDKKYPAVSKLFNSSGEEVIYV